MEHRLRNNPTMLRTLVTATVLACAAQFLPAQSLYERPIASPPSRASSAPGHAKPAPPADPDAPMPMQTP